MLRSTDTTDYILPRTRIKFVEHGFCFSATATWDSSPSDLHDVTDTDTVKNGSLVHFSIANVSIRAIEKYSQEDGITTRGLVQRRSKSLAVEFSLLFI